MMCPSHPPPTIKPEREGRGEREREGEREGRRERETDRQTDRQTERERERERETRTQKLEYSRIVVLGPFGPYVTARPCYTTNTQREGEKGGWGRMYNSRSEPRQTFCRIVFPMDLHRTAVLALYLLLFVQAETPSVARIKPFPSPKV